MELSVETRAAAQIGADALVSYAFEGDKPIEGALAELDRAVGGSLARLVESKELTGKWLEMTLLHYPEGMKAERLLVIGAGKREKFSATELRKIAAAAARYLKARSVKRLSFVAREEDRTAIAAEAIAEGLLLGEFEADKYKSEKKNGNTLEAASLAGWGGAAQAEAERGLRRGRVIAESQNFARELGNEPSNYLTPRMLEHRAVQMARDIGLAIEVFDEKKLAELKMGALLSVAQGSAEPPRLLVLTYTPEKTAPGAPVLGLVGKAVTFDTGGISIKPATNMEEMKFDMCGGAAMLGAMRAIAHLKPAIKVIGIVPATENMPSGTAQKPGDVQTAMSGKTIEVINTDAEGRLILSDALHYARQLGCTHLVDAATLTGAIVVALANVNTGVFGSNPKFTEQLIAASRVAGEKMWPMPVDDDYREMIKSTIADIQNVGSGKGGGASTAAAFLHEFTGETPWVHLDIAGTAWLTEGKPWSAKGATGVAVRTCVELAMQLGG
ncbi:MAG TPA: leucyl aminopeptidase [Candidatus Acidoferrales bacterium]|nr:leucyl aminopeptidase [Candidatus Acidoferrales bacterium]